MMMSQLLTYLLGSLYLSMMACMIDIRFRDDFLGCELIANKSLASAYVPSMNVVNKMIIRLYLLTKHFQFLYSYLSPRSKAMPVFPDVLGFWLDVWLPSTFVMS